MSKSLSTLMLTVLLGVVATPALAAGQKFTIAPYHTAGTFHLEPHWFSNPGAVVNVSKGTLRETEALQSRFGCLHTANAFIPTLA